MSSSSRDLEASGKLDAVFSCHSEWSQNTFSRCESSVHSVFRSTDPASVGKSLLQGDKIICLIKQGLYL